MAKSVATVDTVLVHGSMDGAKHIAILTIIILDMWSVTRGGASIGQEKNQRNRNRGKDINVRSRGVEA